MRTEFGADEAPLHIKVRGFFAISATHIHLDPKSKTLRAEWLSLSRKSPIEVRFEDISNVEKEEMPAEGPSDYWIRLELKSGERHRIPAGGERRTREAVDKIKAYIGWTKDDIVTSPRSIEVGRNDRLMVLAGCVFLLLFLLRDWIWSAFGWIASFIWALTTT